MSIKTTQEAEDNFNELIEEVNLSHHPITITGKQHNAVLVS